MHILFTFQQAPFNKSTGWKYTYTYRTQLGWNQSILMRGAGTECIVRSWVHDTVSLSLNICNIIYQQDIIMCLSQCLVGIMIQFISIWCRVSIPNGLGGTIIFCRLPIYERRQVFLCSGKIAASTYLHSPLLHLEAERLGCEIISIRQVHHWDTSCSV